MPEQQGPEGAQALATTLLSSGYLKMLLLAALVGVPVSLAAFGFVSLEHEMQHWVWESLPAALGYDDRPPWWWPLPTLLLTGLLVAPVVTRMPGRGGHLPVQGLGGPPTPPSAVPSVVIAALICLPLGAVLGPEAPLMGLGSGLALLAVRSAKRKAHPQIAPVLGTAGSTAAIATIFGSPLIAPVMVLEAAGLGGPQLLLLVLPVLLASGVGALVFTGFGHWTGLSIGALSLPAVPHIPVPRVGEFLWGVPVAVLITVLLTAAHALGGRTAAFTARHTAVRTVLCAVAVGGCIAAYALVTGRSPEEAALSGQATLATLASDPQAWSIGALVALVFFKGLGWAVSLGSLRGGPIFPTILLGAAVGVAFGALPGLGTGTGLAVGLVSSVAALTRLPLTSTVFAAVLLGGESADAMPLLLVCAVVSVVCADVLRGRFGPSAKRAAAAPAGTGGV